MRSRLNVPGVPSWRRIEWRRYMLAAVMALATPAWSQPAPAEGAGEQEHRLRPGVWLNSVTFDLGAYNLPPSLTGGDPTGRALWLLDVGGAAAITWQLPGTLMATSVDYSLGYSGNQRLGMLNGWDQTISIRARTPAARRFGFGLTATGQSRRMYSSLFDAGRTLAIAQQPFPNAATSTARLDDAAALAASPADLAFSGARRRLAALHMGLSYSHSRRITSHLDIGVGRDFRSTSPDAGVRSPFPPVTVGMANGGITYSVARRTRIDMSGGYARSYSRLDRLHWQSAGLGLQRDIGRRSFLYGRGGYGRTESLGAARNARHSYTAAAGLGTVKDYHTVIATFSRGIGDSYGLGSDTSIGVESGWAWARPASPWTLRSSVGHARFGGRGVDLRSWLYHGSVARRLTPTFSLSFDAAYVRTRGTGFGSRPANGVSLSCIWTPLTAEPVLR